eukprot:COSAG05_NODE_6540_length_940_cov_1.834721_1_plen_274_part_10
MDSYSPDYYADEAVSLNSVLKNFNLGAPDTVNLVFLDCCRDNELDTTFKVTKAASGGRGKSTITGKGIRAPAKTQFLIGLACDPGTVALTEKGARNSYYTAALLRQLPVPGRAVVVTMQEVLADVLRSTDDGQRTWYECCMTEEMILVEGNSPDDQMARQRSAHLRQQVDLAEANAARARQQTAEAEAAGRLKSEELARVHEMELAAAHMEAAKAEAEASAAKAEAAAAIARSQQAQAQAAEQQVQQVDLAEANAARARQQTAEAEAAGRLKSE